MYWVTWVTFKSRAQTFHECRAIHWPLIQIDGVQNYILNWFNNSKTLLFIMITVRSSIHLKYSTNLKQNYLTIINDNYEQNEIEF